MSKNKGHTLIAWKYGLKNSLNKLDLLTPMQYGLSTRWVYSSFAWVRGDASFA